MRPPLSSIPEGLVCSGHLAVKGLTEPDAEKKEIVTYLENLQQSTCCALMSLASFCLTLWKNTVSYNTIVVFTITTKKKKSNYRYTNKSISYSEDLEHGDGSIAASQCWKKKKENRNISPHHQRRLHSLKFYTTSAKTLPGYLPLRSLVNYWNFASLFDSLDVFCGWLCVVWLVVVFTIACPWHLFGLCVLLCLPQLS